MEDERLMLSKLLVAYRKKNALVMESRTVAIDGITQAPNWDNHDRVHLRSMVIKQLQRVDTS